MENGLIFQLNSLMFPEIMRDFFGMIDKFIYFLIEKCIDLMYDLANNRFGLENEIDGLISNFYAVFIIFMIFKLTLSMLNYIVNPEAFTDKNAGFSKLVSRVIIAVILLVSINPIFNFLFTFQSDIIGTSGAGNVIDNLILSNQEMKTVTIDGEEIDVYLTRMSDYCPENYKVYSLTKGGMFAISALKPFYQPTPYGEVEKKSEWEDFLNNSGYGYCGLDYTDENTLKDSYYNYFNYSYMTEHNGTKSFLSVAFESAIGAANIALGAASTIFNLAVIQSGIDENISVYGYLAMPHAGSEFIKHDIYNNITGNWDWNYNEVFVIDFRYFWGLVFGIAILFMIITFCFDIVVRALTLFLYQLIAPIPIISYMSPNKKDTDMLMNWVKKTLTCWASIFVRIAILDFVVYFSQVALNTLDNSGSGIVIQIFVLVGTLMFAKKLPKLIEDIIPGLKMGDPLELNPFKRISRDALGGNLLLGAGAGIAGMGLAAGTNFGHRMGQTIMNTSKAERGKKLSTFGRGLAKTAGSTVAGGARGFTNSFNRTRKDGNVFGGAWNGYQTAMFSKLIREDNLRKAGIAEDDFVGRMRLMGKSVVSDASRYAGILNAGQREYLAKGEIDAQIKKLDAGLEAKERPYKLYNEYMSFIDGKINADSKVKEAELRKSAAYNAEYNSDAERDAAIRAASDAVTRAKSDAFHDLRNNNKHVKDAINRINDLRYNNSELAGSEFDLGTVDGDTGLIKFNSKAMNIANDEKTVLEQKHAEKVYQYKYGTGTIETYDRDSNGNIIQIQTVREKYGDKHDYDYYQQEFNENKVANNSRTNTKGQEPGFQPSPDRLGEFRDRQYFGGTHGGPHGGGGHHGGGGSHGGGPGPGTP